MVEKALYVKRGDLRGPGEPCRSQGRWSDEGAGSLSDSGVREPQEKANGREVSTGPLKKMGSRTEPARTYNRA